MNNDIIYYKFEITVCLMQALVLVDFKVMAACVMITHEFHFHLALLEDGNFILSLVYFGFKLTFCKDIRWICIFIVLYNEFEVIILDLFWIIQAIFD